MCLDKYLYIGSQDLYYYHVYLLGFFFGGGGVYYSLIYLSKISYSHLYSYTCVGECDNKLSSLVQF